MNMDEYNARQKSLHEGYIARELARLGGRRATAGDLKKGDRFVIPMRAEHEPMTIEKLKIQGPNLRGTRVVIFKTTDRAKSQWMEDHQAVVIL